MSAHAELRAVLRQAAETERVPVLQRFFKTGAGEYAEGDVFLGVRVPASRAVAKRFADRLTLADSIELLRSPFHEERFVGLVLMVRRYGRGDGEERSRVFEGYLVNTERVNNWDLVDVSAPHIVGAHLQSRSREVLHRLASSSSVWERRIAVLATFAFIRADDIDETIRLAKRLIDDPHHLIHKAVGWMLREVGKRDEPRLVAFLDRYGNEMPATMRSYASERASLERRT